MKSIGAPGSVGSVGTVVWLISRIGVPSSTARIEKGEAKHATYRNTILFLAFVYLLVAPLLIFSFLCPCLLLLLKYSDPAGALS